MKAIVSMAAGAVLAAALGSTALAPRALAQAGGVAEIEAKMKEYITVWNTHDVAQVLAKVYRMPDTAMGTPAGLQANFDQLKAQGYDHSVLHGVRGCLITPETGLGEMRFTRLKTDGTFMPPEMRTSVYQLKKFPDGWRITSFGAGPTNCFTTPSAAAPARAN